ncbi:MAG TPA: hypothetical protein VKT33_15320, partial [Candidatus Angelobacter sp.]|nr:hypothetical protein [Candidatus Angelobacter sp.]
MSAFADDTEVIKQQLLAQPPQVLVDAVKQDPSGAIQVNFFKADLDGSGQFRFLLAAYSQQLSGWGVYLRVFKQEGSTLRFIGEQEDQDPHGGYGLTIDFVDIDGDGIPEFDLSGTEISGRQITHEYFRWTGTSLHEMLDTDEAFAADGLLEDIDGDGKLELLIQRGVSQYKVYKFDGTNFTLFGVLNHDPSGLINSDGTIRKVRAMLTRLEPSAFPLAEIASAKPVSDDKRQDADHEKGKVKLTIGELRDLKGKIVAVEQVDVTTLLLGRNLRPMRSAIHPDGHKAGNVLQLEFDRQDVLHLLPRLK